MFILFTLLFVMPLSFPVNASNECRSIAEGGCIRLPDEFKSKPRPGQIQSHEFTLFYDRNEPKKKIYVKKLNGLEIEIPRKWLASDIENKLEENALVSSFNFTHIVNSFLINSELLGLHLSSYAVQKEGSENAATGRDVFLVLDNKTNELIGKLSLGITQSRSIYTGCTQTLSNKFEVGDINEDGSFDIGVVKTENLCEEKYDEEADTDRIATTNIKHDKQWYVFKESTWHLSDDYSKLDTKSSKRFPSYEGE